MTHWFEYKQNPIASLSTLATSVGLKETALRKLILNSDSHYKLALRKIKKDGTVREVFKASEQLSYVLKMIKSRILDKVEIPKYITAGRKGRNYVQNASHHLNTEVVVADDIKQFFPSIRQSHINNLFQYFFKFSPEVSNALSHLCTKDGYLVQGSPISGDIANLIFYDCEPELVGWLESVGLRYTRYYDDIHISPLHENYTLDLTEIRRRLYGMFGKKGVEPHRSNQKSRVMYGNNRIDIHDVTVNSKKTSPAKKRVSATRAQLHQFTMLVSADGSVKNILEEYRSLAGKIQTLKAQGSPKYHKMQRELIGELHNINKVSAKRFTRRARKVKTRKELGNFAALISPLKKIDARLSAVIKAELNTAKNRLKNS